VKTPLRPFWQLAFRIPGFRVLWKRASQNLAFRREFVRFAALSRASGSRFPVRWEDRKAFLDDKTDSTSFDTHYVYHCAWAARVLAKTRPKSHVDISSSLNFSTIVSAFVPVRFYDFRPPRLILPGLEVQRADLCALPLPTASIQSLSCMHVVEHIGLGRYGDPLDPDGDLKAIAELKRVMASGGSLLFVVPVGKPKLVFNGHRIYSHRQIREYFGGLDLKQFVLIPDNAAETGILYDPTEERADAQRYGCGCFWFQKLSS